MNDDSTLLFANPSLLGGAGSVLDMGGTFTTYNSMESPQQADAAAIASDFRAVGDDIRQAMASFATHVEEMKDRK